MSCLHPLENATLCLTASSFSPTDFPSPSTFQSGTTTTAPTAIAALKRGDNVSPRYGFGGVYHSQFTGLPEHVVRSTVLLPRPDETPAWRRCAMRKAAEDLHFDPNKLHNASLPADTALFAHALRYIPPASPLPLPSSLSIPPSPLQPSLSSIFSRSSPPGVGACIRFDEGVAADLTGILYSAVYVECLSSGLTSVHCAPLVTVLAPALSFLEHSRSARDALCGAYRRSLIYSPFTNIVLSGRVLRHVGNLFDGGVSETRLRLSAIIRKLQILFYNHVVLRVHCKLFFDDYSKWIDTVPDEILRRLAEDVVDISHACTIPFDLEWEWRCVDQEDGDSVEQLPPCPRSIDDTPAPNTPVPIDAIENFIQESCARPENVNDDNENDMYEDQNIQLNQTRGEDCEASGYACIYTRFQLNNVSRPVFSKKDWVPKGSSCALSDDSCTDYIHSRRSSDDCTPPSIRAKWSEKA